MLKHINRNSVNKCEICSKLTLKIPEWRRWRCRVSVVNFEHISNLFPVFLLLTLNMCWGKFLTRNPEFEIHLWALANMRRQVEQVISNWLVQDYSRFTGQQGKEEAISLSLLYHFYPFHRHLDISRITEESSPLHIASSRRNHSLICSRNSLAGFCMMGKLILNQLIGYCHNEKICLVWIFKDIKISCEIFVEIYFDGVFFWNARYSYIDIRDILGNARYSIYLPFACWSIICSDLSCK